MLVFCHLWVGAVIGVLLSRYLKDDTALPVCCICSLLPDLIDKPIGHLIISEMQDGRIYCHTIFFVMVWILGSYLFFRSHKNFKAIILGGSCGILSHQLLDQMWEMSENWFYPFLGPFPTMQFDNYFAWGMMKELTTLSEWFFGSALLIMIYLTYNPSIRIWRSQTIPGLYWGIAGVLVLLIGH